MERLADVTAARPGLRLQILLLLGGLLLAAFLPLFFAITTYTRPGVRTIKILPRACCRKI